MTEDQSLIARMLSAVALSIAAGVVGFFVAESAVQAVAVPLDHCFDLDAGGRLAMFMEWLMLVFLASLTVVATTAILGYFSWRLLALGFVIGFASMLVAIGVWYVEGSAEVARLGCELSDSPGYGMGDAVNTGYFSYTLWLATVVIGATVAGIGIARSKRRTH